MRSYLILLLAILFETLGTSFLKKTENFSKLAPTLIFAIAMTISFYLLTHALREIPIGIAYAIWSAVGIVLISLVGYFVYKESLDLPAILGISFIVIGVVIINVFSKSTAQ